MMLFPLLCLGGIYGAVIIGSRLFFPSLVGRLLLLDSFTVSGFTT
jgi:hypothetical protein